MTAWIINSVGLFLVTTGTLLIFLYLWKTPRLAEESAAPGDTAAAKKRNLLVVAVGLLAVWFLLQCLTVIFL